jgi:glycosyltransferase involved in cell wall biosynthesis
MPKKLRIAQVAPLWITIPPKKYGGIERIISLLCDGLVDKGHDVTLFASPGSKTKAKLVSVYDKPLLEAGIEWSNPIWNLRNLSKAYEFANKGKFDIIHTHLDIWSLFFCNLSSVPTIQTMHNPMYRTNADALKTDRLRLFLEESKNINIVFISESARNCANVKFKDSQARIIYNATEIKDFKFNPKPKDHFVWIARMDKHKGIENAIAVAEKLDLKLLVAGRIDPVKQGYFNTVIKPHLNSRIKYVGELTEKQLSKFYGEARALLYPIEWEEPFGLVVTEAMATGTPVVAYDRGSMKELIKDKETGFVVPSNINAFAAAIKKIDTIDRAKVRKSIEQRFSPEIMVENYEETYYQIINKGKNNEEIAHRSYAYRTLSGTSS